MASEKAKELADGIAIYAGPESTITARQIGAAIDAAVAPLLDLLNEYLHEDPETTWAETTERTEALLRAWGRK
jgi:hypothetical protein